MRQVRRLLAPPDVSETVGKPPLFRIEKGGHVSHFHNRCPQWPQVDYYEQEKPLWWGQVCPVCSRLAEEDVRIRGLLPPRSG